MTREERVQVEYIKMLDTVNKQSSSLSDKSLQMMTLSLLQINITLAQILDMKTSDDAER